MCIDQIQFLKRVQILVTLNMHNPTITSTISGDIRIFPDFRNSHYYQFQAAWVTKRRRGTRRRIMVQAVSKYHHSFCRKKVNNCQNLRMFHAQVMVQLYAALVEKQQNCDQYYTKHMHSHTVAYDIHGTVICAQFCDKIMATIHLYIYKK